MKPVALVVGGSDGLGKEVAQQLSSTHRVVILARNEEKLARVANQLGVAYVVADVTEYEAVEAAIKQIMDQYARIDLLVNSAGIYASGYVEMTDPDRIEAVLKVNTLGMIYTCRAVAGVMKQQQSGQIVNIVSRDALVAKSERSVYSASKWGARGFTQTLRRDLQPEGIGVTAVYPGLMDTDLFEKADIERDTAGGLEPSQVAEVIAYLVNMPSEVLVSEISLGSLRENLSL